MGEGNVLTNVHMDYMDSVVMEDAVVVIGIYSTPNKDVWRYSRVNK